MVKPEITGRRDLTYSRWHRTLPSYCYMVDIDCVEWRSTKGVVALIETCIGTAIAYKKKFQLRVLKEIAGKLGVPCYLVIYYPRNNYPRNDKITLFEVYSLQDGEFPNCPKQVMTEGRFRDFLKSL